MNARLLAWIFATLVLVPAAARAQGIHRQVELPVTSQLDAQGLGSGRLAFGMGMGFPYVQVMGAYGVGDGVDLDVNVDTLYGAAAQLGVGPKLRLAGDQAFAVAFALQAQAAVFRHPVVDETSTGSRHVTGLRNFGLQPALVASTRGRFGSLFGIAQYQETYSTEVETNGPLSGQLSHFGGNIGVYVGGELGSGNTPLHFFALLGVDFHLRATDSPALPRIEVGFTFPG